MKLTVCLLAPLALFFSGFANADVVTYTESATIDGSLGSSTFTGAALTLTFVSDTTDVTSLGGGLFTNTSGSLTIAGVGTATITDEVQAVDNQGVPVAGFGDNTEDLFILGTNDSVFSTYGLTTSIGPITDTAEYNPGSSFATDEGAFIISNVDGQATFTAVVGASTPEPGTTVLIGIGLAGLAALRRRK
jgi:hypothetical protein